LLRRGLEDESPACRGSALLSLERLSREHPGVVNGVRPLLHELVARDGNEAVRRLGVMSLKNGSSDRGTIQLLDGLAGDDELPRRGLEGESPACRGSALLSLERLSREHPGVVNGVRPLLHELVARDGNEAVRRLGVMSLKNGSSDRGTIQLLDGLAGDDEQP